MQSIAIPVAVLVAGIIKVAGIGAVGFGIAWWRSRALVRRLETEKQLSPGLERRIEHLEQTLDDITASLGRIEAGHRAARTVLPPSHTGS